MCVCVLAIQENVVGDDVILCENDSLEFCFLFMDQLTTNSFVELVDSVLLVPISRESTFCKTF